MIDAEKFVRHHWPNAKCSGPWVNGRIQKGGTFVITLKPPPMCASHPGTFGGSGKTEIEAWADAANRLEARAAQPAEGEKKS